MINTVLRNLISNAIKFSPLNSSIEISARQKGAKIELEIRDHGEGIALSLIEQINSGLWAWNRVLALKVRKGQAWGFAPPLIMLKSSEVRYAL